MKILIAFHEINNYGGIINNQEALHLGLAALGHDVHVVRLDWKSEIGKVRISTRRISQQRGMFTTFDQERGWNWPAKNRFAYKGERQLRRWKDFASQFDAIIWQIPVPTKRRQNFGNSDWVKLYDLPSSVKQVAYAHDAHIGRTPWIYEVCHQFRGVAFTNSAGFGSGLILPVPTSLIITPQANIAERLNNTAWSGRTGFLSLQTFKGWKHVDDLVRAIPHMKNTEKKMVAGGGLHYHYMTSRDKMKPVYIGNVDKDPDIDPKNIGVPIWTAAESAGMKYCDYVSAEIRDQILGTSKFLIDPSWSHAFAEHGEHYNRTVFESLIAGAIPIARNIGITSRLDGNGELFVAGANYFMIRWDATPKEFADVVDNAMCISEVKYREMLLAGREVLRHVDHVQVAKEFVKLINGESCGVHGSRVGAINDELETAAKKAMSGFFAGVEDTSEDEGDV
jgi:glycosyltransferase involved in cell wall biosynthesis